MAGATVQIAILGDASNAVKAFDQTAGAAQDATRHIDDASKSVDRMGEHMDKIASRSSQASGGVGDLGGALSAIGGEESTIGKIGAQMESIAPIILGVTGAMDLLTLATSAFNLANLKAAASTVAQKTATIASSVATKAAAATQWLLNAAMSANPIGLIVAAIVALVAGFVLAYKKSETFRKIVDAAFRGIKQVIGVVISAVKAYIATWIAIFQGLAKATLSVWNSIVSWTRNTWNALVSIVSGVVSRVKSAVSNAWSAVKTATSNAWSGIKTAVSNAISGLISFVSELPGKIKGALSGAASWLYQTGKDIIQGMIDGIGSMGGVLVDAAKNIAKKFMGGVKDFFGISSPSKEMKKLGKFVMDGFILGITGSSDKLKSTMDNLTKLVKDAFSGKTETKWLSRISTDNKALKTLLDSRARVLASAAQQTAKLNDLIQKRADVVSNIAGVVRQGFQLVDQAAQSGNTSMRSILERGTKAVQAAQQFAANLNILKARGVAADVLQEIAQAGPEAGAATVRAFLGASKDQINAVNSNYAALAKAGQQAGGVVGDSFYLAGINATKQLINGLRSEEATLNKQIQTIANNLDKALRKALNLKPGKKLTLPTTIGKQTLTKPTAVAKPTTPTAQKPTIVIHVNAGAVIQNDRQLADTIVNAINNTVDTLGRPYELSVVTP